MFLGRRKRGGGGRRRQLFVRDRLSFRNRKQKQTTHLVKNFIVLILSFVTFSSLTVLSYNSAPRSSFAKTWLSDISSSVCESEPRAKLPNRGENGEIIIHETMMSGMAVISDEKRRLRREWKMRMSGAVKSVTLSDDADRA